MAGETPPDRRAGGAPLWAGAAATALAGVLVGIGLKAVEPRLPALIPAYSRWALDRSEPQWLLWWLLGDTTEATLYKSALGGLLMVCGAAYAHAGARKGRARGFPLACATGLWPWVAVSAGLALVLSNLAWGWTLTASDAWQPTFAPFVSVPPALVVLYGRGWRVAVTGAVLGVVLVTPAALLLVDEVCVPLGLSPVVGSVTGMSLGGAAAFALCRALPWMPDLPAAPAAPAPVEAPVQGAGWVVRRVLADFTEAHFYGNEWAGAGLLLGTVAAFLLNPAAVAYGSGLLPHMMAAQILAAVCGVVLWRRRWASAGWYPTFVPVVSVTPATVLTYGGSPASIAAGAALGALAAPPLAAELARRLPSYIHPMVAYTATMAICTATIVPLLGLFPGF
ncbi:MULTISPECIES: hypothetical protein [unclassified Streptomyces]|uniref:hypothetical protein n=1 Tax=unclassified Streptomyces TaxID=2593676 RepID=UPI00336A1B7C